MHVVVNQWTPQGSKTGVGHYTDALLHGLRSRQEQTGSPHSLVIASADSATSAAGSVLNSSRGPSASPGKTMRKERWESRLLLVSPSPCLLVFLRCGARPFMACGKEVGPSWAGISGRYARSHFDLYHEPNFIPLPGDCPTVTTLHDLSVLLYPQWHPANRVYWFERHLPEMLSRCVHFLTISDFGRQEVIRRLSVPPDRITRVYMGVRPGLVPLPTEQVAITLAQLGLSPGYLLYVGTIEPRKNMLMLMQAYCALPEQVRNRRPLVLAGSWGWNAAAAAEYYYAEARHRGVICLGYIPDALLPALYNGARALVYPSWYEGFGLPPLEMMACGGTVLASTAGSIVETVGSRAYLIDPADLDGWHSAMLRVLNDDDWWLSLRHGVVDIARPYTSARCAAETWNLYRRLGQATAQPGTGCGRTA